MGLMLDTHNATRVAAPLPQPEDILLAWLVAQPEGGDLSAAVGVEILRLERYRGPHPGPGRLKDLFIELGRELEVSQISGRPQ